MGLSIIGGGNAVLAEVETTQKALRANLRPIDVGALGSYSASVVSGIMAAGIAGASPILAFRWAPATVPTSLALIRRVKLTAWNLGTGFAAGVFTFNMFVARAFTVQDTGGGAVTLTTHNAKLRTSHAVTQATIQASATATLTAGTRVKDANPLRTISGVVANAAFAAMLPEQTEMFRQQPGEHPLVLATGEGFAIEATVPATGTWSWAAQIDWDEVTAATFA
jgi:hypothetical protein